MFWTTLEMLRLQLQNNARMVGKRMDGLREFSLRDPTASFLLDLSGICDLTHSLQRKQSCWIGEL